jgi:cytidyltransferase-like protein
MLHSGQVRFLEEAADFGELYVGIGSDQTVKELKGRYPVTPQKERQYLLESLKYVVRFHHHQFGQSADRRITDNMKREVSAICKEYGTPRDSPGRLLHVYARLKRQV